MPKTITAHAKVRVTLELSHLGSWGDNCTVAQVQQQAIEQAIGRCRQAFKNNSAMNLIGEPEVVMVTYPEKE
jgi:hypothetical protein